MIYLSIKHMPVFTQQKAAEVFLCGLCMHIR